MNNAAKHLPPLDQALWRSQFVQHGHLLIKALVRPGVVEIRDLLYQHPLEMALVHHQQMVQAFLTD